LGTRVLRGCAAGRTLVQGEPRGNMSLTNTRKTRRR
jgi:hypothetical protein